MSTGNYLRSLTEQHPESVAQLFKAHQVSLDPTYSNLKHAYEQCGQPFLDDLNRVFGEYSNYDGQPKPTGFKGAINGMVDLIKDKERLALYDQGRLQSMGIPVQTPNGGIVYIPRIPAELNAGIMNREPYYNDGAIHLPDRIFGMNKSLFFVLLGMLTVVVFMELFQRKH